MHDQDVYARTRAPAQGGAHEADDSGSKVAVAADTAKETVKDEARTVAATAKQDAGAVVGEARSQVRRLTSQARDRATDRVRGSHNQFVDRLRSLSDEFAEMGAEGDSPGRALVSDLGQRGRRVADYLADRGPEGLLSEVTDFARRRPAAFLAAAAAAGFLVGRLGKGIWKAQSDDKGTGSTPVRPEPRAADYPERIPADPQWTEPAPVATGVAPVPGTVAAAPVTPAVPGMPVSEPVPATPYVQPTYDDPYRAAGPGGEPR